MRIKIIAVNAIIVVLVGLLSFWVMRSASIGAANNPPVLLADAKHDVEGASARLQLDGLRVERWLAAKAAEPDTLNATLTVLTQADPTQAGRSATTVCDQVLAAAKSSPAFGGVSPSLVILVDQAGTIAWRWDWTEDKGEMYLAVETLNSGVAGAPGEPQS